MESSFPACSHLPSITTIFSFFMYLFEVFFVNTYSKIYSYLKMIFLFNLCCSTPNKVYCTMLHTFF